MERVANVAAGAVNAVKAVAGAVVEALGGGGGDGEGGGGGGGGGGGSGGDLEAAGSDVRAVFDSCLACPVWDIAVVLGARGALDDYDAQNRSRRPKNPNFQLDIEACAASAGRAIIAEPARAVVGLPIVTRFCQYWGYAEVRPAIMTLWQVLGRTLAALMYPPSGAPIAEALLAQFHARGVAGKESVFMMIPFCPKETG